MTTEIMALQLPVAVYDQLQLLATEVGADPADVVERLVAVAGQQHAWRHNLASLRERIRRDGGLHVGATRDEASRASASDTM